MFLPLLRGLHGFRLIRFLARRKGGDGKPVGAEDVLAYAYLILGVAVVLVPVSWTFLSSLKPAAQIDTFDTRLLPYDQVTVDVPGQGRRDVYTWDREGSPPVTVFKAGPTRRHTFPP
jgi:alpha-1,4-digalacturonate transport system permease protein